MIWGSRYLLGPSPLCHNFQKSRSPLRVFLSAEDKNHLALLEKILLSVEVPMQHTSLWEMPKLDWARWSLCAGKFNWIFGDVLPLRVGMYDLSAQPTQAPRVWILPSLAQMENNPSYKKQCWDLIRSYKGRFI
ncbi:MAG: hypothetical protein ACUVRD_08470 [Bacteroidia bacterium]